jgi:hypothetical protein
MRLTDPAWETLNEGRTHWLNGIWAADCETAVAVGKKGTVLLGGGSAGWLDISPQMPDVDWAGVWGTGPDDFFVVGSRGVIMRYRPGRPWTVWELVSRANLEAVWGTSVGDIYAVGQDGVIMHFDGFVWEAMESNTSSQLQAIHGRGAADVYAVGHGGTIVHFDGIVWTTLTSGVSGPLEAVWCRPGGETVVVGEAGLSLHGTSGDGGQINWESRGSGTVFSLFGLTGDPDGKVYAAGSNGLVLEYNGGDWNSLPTTRHDQLDAIAIDPCGDLYCAGYWGLILEYTY